MLRRFETGAKSKFPIRISRQSYREAMPPRDGETSGLTVVDWLRIIRIMPLPTVLTYTIAALLLYLIWASRSRRMLMILSCIKNASGYRPSVASTSYRSRLLPRFVRPRASAGAETARVGAPSAAARWADEDHRVFRTAVALESKRRASADSLDKSRGLIHPTHEVAALLPFLAVC